jgi:hypothetical protein
MPSIPSRIDYSFLSSFKGDSRSFRSESRYTRSDTDVTGSENTRGRRVRRGKGGEQVDPNAPVVSTQPVPTPTTPSTPTPSAPPTSPSSNTGSNTDGTIRSLAEKYVDIYAQQSGRSLSSTTRDALVNEVASFYGENGSRTDRLRTLVGVF